MIELVKFYSGLRGFTTCAFNTHVDYLRLAYAQALSNKIAHCLNEKVAIVVDKKTHEQLKNYQHGVFDSVITVDEPLGFDQAWQVRNLSPWKHTICTDADILFTRDISHWWNWLEQWDVFFPTVVEDFRGEVIKARDHRKLFDTNHLPNIYTAFYYFKDSTASGEFFEQAAEISKDWDWYANQLIGNHNPDPRDDEIFALAAQIIGEENCTCPEAVFPRFVHLRESINRLHTDRPWHEQIECNWYANSKLWIGNYCQELPVHYINKDAITDEFISQLERDYEKLVESNTGVQTS